MIITIAEAFANAILANSGVWEFAISLLSENIISPNISPIIAPKSALTFAKGSGEILFNSML